MPRQRLLIAIPVFNCEKQIARVLEELSRQIPSWTSQQVEVLVLDNRSTDSSFKVAANSLKHLPAPYHLVKNKKNVGLGGSQKKAFQWALEKDFDFLVILHGDDQASAAEIPALMSVALRDPHLSAVLGSRFSVKSKRIGYSKIRTFGNCALNLAYSIFTFRKVVDLGSGLNLFTVRSFETTDFSIFSNGFSFNMDLLLHLIGAKRRFTFVPITWVELDQVSNARNIRVGWAALKALLLWRFGKNSQKASAPLAEPNDFEIILSQSSNT